MQSNSLSQHISHTTRNTDKSKSLLDLALTNCKFICQAGTLDHYISDHQPIYLIHRKSKDKRKSVKFEGRSYRSFDENVFGAPLKELRIFFMKLRVLREPESVKFEGRSYRSFDENVFGAPLKELSENFFFEIKGPEGAWGKILSNICTVLDEMCPVLTFHVKNYRPDWMTKELIEQIKDRS